jgi:L-lactate dehydrogenase
VDALAGTNSAFTVQVWDPDAFGGQSAFLRQTGWLADACRANPPKPGVEQVRLPGEAALARRADAMAHGVPLYPTIMPSLADAASRLGIAMPGPV